MNLVKQGDWACPFYRMALRLVPSGQLAQCNIGIDVPAFLSVVVKPININQPYSHIVHTLPTHNEHPCRQRHKGHRGDWLHPSEPLLKVNFGCTDTLSLLFRLTFLSALLNLSSLLKNRMIHRVDSLYIGLSASFFANLTFIV